MTDKSLIKIDLGELSKPATALIEKISDAVGGLYKPYQIVRVAKAEAEAELIRAETEIEITERTRRALGRFISEEEKKQANMEDITQKSLPHLNEDSSPQDMEDDWITNFFEKCRIVSNDEMQQLWARILAGEANTPGTFSRRTVNLLSDLDKRDAVLFTHLCGFCWMINEFTPLVYDVKEEIYNHLSINFRSLSHLQALGLVRFDNVAGFTRTKLPKDVKVSYYDRQVDLELPLSKENKLDIGKVLLTQAGQELAPFSGSAPVDGFFDYVYNIWVRKALVLPVGESEQEDSANV